MKRLALLLLLAGVTLVAWRPPVAHPQEPSAPLRLEVTAHGRPHLLPVPLPDPKTLEQEVDKAIREMEARQGIQRRAREVIEGSGRGPHLSYDVVNGIQSLEINKALRSGGR